MIITISFNSCNSYPARRREGGCAPPCWASWRSAWRDTWSSTGTSPPVAGHASKNTGCA